MLEGDILATDRNGLLGVKKKKEEGLKSSREEGSKEKSEP